MDTKYWDLAIYFPRDLLCYFETLKNDLKLVLNDTPNCLNLSVCGNEYCFLIAMTKEMYNKNILLIKERIADIIMIYYKPKFIINSIKNFDLKLHDNVILIDILTSFDFLEDKNSIIKKLSLCKKLYLESFVYFKLQKLISSWFETGELINQNSLFMIDNSIKKELIQFLMSGIASKMDNIKLALEKDKICFKTPVLTQPLHYSIYDYDAALFTIIKNYPKKIEVEHYKDFDVRFIQNLHELFSNRLCLLE